MNFGAMQSLVGEQTKRPDKVSEIKSAINFAVELSTNRIDWAADLSEASLPLDNTLYAQNLVISTLFTRFRKMKYLRPAGYRKYLTWWDSANVFDAAGCEVVDSWYRAGDNIILKLSALQSSILVGYYKYHLYLVNAGDTHWMMDMFPQLVADKASARVFAGIGNDQEAARYEKFAFDAFQAASAARDGVAYA